MKFIISFLIIALLYWNISFDNYTTACNQPDPKYKKGQELFRRNCIACHSIDMDKILTAPALAGITKRREKKWLYEYTRNSYRMYLNGDSIAQKLRSEGWGLMSSFPSLSDQNLDAIYYFVDKKSNTGN